MSEKYSVETCKELQKRFEQAALYRPMRIARYEPGTELVYDVTGLAGAECAKVRLNIEKFVGGGFAGQVYVVKILDIENNKIQGLQVGEIYAIKILVPPSGFSELFRNILYWIGFQGPFQLQVNPAAARAGALWQKFIRRAAKIQFGDETVVKDVYATFVDSAIGSCGEISDWVEGRTWRLEVDDQMDQLKLWKKKLPYDEPRLGSPEYRTKKEFMRDFVKLLHNIGAHEFARQYEWSTCKSQPNCLKLTRTNNDPASGLVAVDFRAGLTLLPVLPMSPGDFMLIWQGLKRGSIVQFDRGDLKKLEQFVESNSEHFSDMRTMLDELKANEQIYRSSLPDVTHNHIRLFYDGKLWSTIFGSAVTGWRVRNIIDEPNERKLRSNKFLTFVFCLLGFIPFLGKFIRRIWASPQWRQHYFSLLRSFDYFCRAVRGRIIEKLIGWHRAGRISGDKAVKFSEHIWRFFFHLPLSILPAGLHRFLTDKQAFKDKLYYIFVRPVRLYFNTELREQWLKDMVQEGQKKHILSDTDAQIILSQLKEPYIQKYLKSLAVHVCTLPVTQVVSVSVAIWYKIAFGLTWGEAWAEMLIILAAFQVTPISPGSLVRGFYVLYLVIRERDFKNYNIAVFLGFFKYIGYLAFPIQMTYRYPALARFMAGHWATEAVHIVPVFGERGALLEHWVFCLFYNWPLTIRRRMAERTQIRANLPRRYWHVLVFTMVMSAVFGFIDFAYFRQVFELPHLRTIWYAVIMLPLVFGSMITLFAGGAVRWKRFVCAAAAGLISGFIYTLFSLLIAGHLPEVWLFRPFIFTILSAIGAIITEFMLPSPNLKRISPQQRLS
ncbi:MAG: YrzE family protein [Phycisphaerae bacterium]